MNINTDRLPYARAKSGPPLKKATWESVLESIQWELRRVQEKGDTKRIPELKEAVRIAKKRVRDKDQFAAIFSTQK